MNQNKIVFISWAPYCSRSDNIARELGGKSYMVYYESLGSNYYTIALKYLLQTVKTLMILFRDRPDTVFVMSPPVIACFPVLIYCKLFRKKYIIDAHTAAFLHDRWKNLTFLNRFFTKRAFQTNVTNETLGKIVEEWGGRFYIVTDVPIVFKDCENCSLSFNKFRSIITLINTFATDEPLETFIKATETFSDVDFYVTGKISKTSFSIVASAPNNVIFTDFLDEQDYAELLRNSDLICVFTDRNYTMLRGAYEAIYLEKPVLISDWKILRDNFSMGASFVDNSLDAIRNGIVSSLNNIEYLTTGAIELKKKKKSQWSEVKHHLLSFDSY